MKRLLYTKHEPTRKAYQAQQDEAFAGLACLAYVLPFLGLCVLIVLLLR